jgi:hypothetical protein
LNVFEGCWGVLLGESSVGLSAIGDGQFDTTARGVPLTSADGPFSRESVGWQRGTAQSLPWIREPAQRLRV